MKLNNCINPRCPNRRTHFELVEVPIRKTEVKMVQMCKPCAELHLARRRERCQTD
jgi:hypothetical protein